MVDYFTLAQRLTEIANKSIEPVSFGDVLADFKAFAHELDIPWYVGASLVEMSVHLNELEPLTEAYRTLSHGITSIESRVNHDASLYLTQLWNGNDVGENDLLENYKTFRDESHNVDDSLCYTSLTASGLRKPEDVLPVVTELINGGVISPYCRELACVHFGKGVAVGELVSSFRENFGEVGPGGSIIRIINQYVLE